MATHVAFLRALNVGGRAVMTMEVLRGVFERAGAVGVRTVIQSGNVLFDAAPADARAIVERVRARLRVLLGSEPAIVVRRRREIAALVARAPFASVRVDASVKLYIVFLDRRPERTPVWPLASAPDALEAIGIDGRDVFLVSRRKKNGMFGFPNNFVEAELGVVATTRNWSTVTKIAGLFG